MEGGDGDYQFLLHRLNHLPRIPPRVPGGSRYTDPHPLGQATPSGCGLEGGGAPCNIPRPEQVIQCLGQVQVPAHPGGIWCGAQGPPPPLQVLVAD